MEIIYRSNDVMSNFNYCSSFLKSKKILNSFNRLNERIIDTSFSCKNVFFEEEIEGNLLITYPLKVVAQRKIKFKSLYDLIKAIRKAYRRIYTEEERTMTKCVKHTPMLLNRGVSDGNYQIWGHVINDLILTGIKIHEGNFISISIDS